MAKRDGGNLNQTNLDTDEHLGESEPETGIEAFSGEAACGEPAQPTLKDYGFSPKGKYFDGTDGQTVGKPVELTERGSAPEGGHAAAMAAMVAIGAKVKASHYQSGMLNVAKGDEGEKIEIPSESNLNSANKRIGA